MSIRMTRREYIDSRPLPKRKVTRKMLFDLMSMRMKQAMRRRGDLPLKRPKAWDYDFGGRTVVIGKLGEGVTSKGGTVYAFTRSQARAEIKAILGIKKGRLPMEVNINEAQPARVGAA